MVLLLIEITNFMSFGPDKVSIRLSDQGLVLIEGLNKDDAHAESNGSGKSAFFEAIVWCLFGKTIRGLRGDDVINQHEGNNCCVVIHGRTKTQQSFTVRRYRKVNHRNGVEFFLGKVEETLQGDPNATQVRIDRALGLTYDIFVNAIMFGQTTRWRFSELNDHDRKELLDKMLGIERLSAALAYVKTKRDHSQRMLASCHSQVINLRDKLETLREVQREARATFIREKQARLTDLKERIQLLETQAAKIEADKLIDIEPLLEKLRRLQAVEVKAERSWLDLRTLSAQLDGKLAHTKETLDKAIADIHRAKKVSIGTLCNACGAKITEKSAALHVKALRRAQKVIERQLDAYKQELLGLKNKLKLWEEKLKSYRNRVKMLSTDIQHARNKNTISQHNQTRLTEIKAEIGVLSKKKTQVAQEKPSLAIKQKAIQEIKRALKVEKETRATHRDLVACYAFWVQGFGDRGIRSYLLDYAMPFLNGKMQQYSQQLMEGLTVEFDTQTQLKSGEIRDKLDISIRNAYGANIYAGNSGGERRKIDIVIARALQALEKERSGVACNIVCWDEVFESLDATSAEAVVTLLHDEIQHRSSVFVITHAEWLKPYFPRRWRVVKQHGYSKMEFA